MLCQCGHTATPIIPIALQQQYSLLLRIPHPLGLGNLRESSLRDPSLYFAPGMPILILGQGTRYGS
jgi:hypothetical protein